MNSNPFMRSGSQLDQRFFNDQFVGEFEAEYDLDEELEEDVSYESESN